MIGRDVSQLDAPFSLAISRTLRDVGVRCCFMSIAALVTSSWRFFLTLSLAEICAARQSYEYSKSRSRMDSISGFEMDT